MGKEEEKQALTGRKWSILQDNFIKLFAAYCPDKDLEISFWNELTECYSEDHRHYHTFQHLDHFYDVLHDFKGQFSDWDAVLFALYYHDVIYDPSKSDNEEQSAGLAVKRMQEIFVNDDVITKTVKLILATKTHVADDAETQLFLDADLAILGGTEEQYEGYSEAIRKEFIVYPDEAYRPGRISVLRHFLEREQIYHSEEFRSKFERQARVNLEREMKLLQSYR